MTRNSKTIPAKTNKNQQRNKQQQTKRFRTTYFFFSFFFFSIDTINMNILWLNCSFHQCFDCCLHIGSLGWKYIIDEKKKKVKKYFSFFFIEQRKDHHDEGWMHSVTFLVNSSMSESFTPVRRYLQKQEEQKNKDQRIKNSKKRRLQKRKEGKKEPTKIQSSCLRLNQSQQITTNQTQITPQCLAFFPHPFFCVVFLFSFEKKWLAVSLSKLKQIGKSWKRIIYKPIKINFWF